MVVSAVQALPPNSAPPKGMPPKVGPAQPAYHDSVKPGTRSRKPGARSRHKSPGKKPAVPKTTK